MTGERRRHPRIPMTVEVVAECESGDTVTLTTNDISGGGAFLQWDDPENACVGHLMKLASDDELMLQVFGMLGDGGEAPRVKAQVVRVMDGGIAVRFDPEELE
ncbi:MULTISPECIES: PilZ domain-containing protein [unclassified Thioalkalivibrio]|uniref:PilZ domain-containing protein n=1 Tax=unclassified Thioalkalivibrio TaxID=2621013 RepID=UPI0009DAFCB4|nr:MULTISPECIES: PilZ domain-containing protein [unclassified Thioalkalivibrio]